MTKIDSQFQASKNVITHISCRKKNPPMPVFISEKVINFLNLRTLKPIVDTGNLRYKSTST